MEPARTLRKAMNTEKSEGEDFWSPAYALIDTPLRQTGSRSKRQVPVTIRTEMLVRLRA
ncbi:hypothetical protein [Streptomyces stelliscabiei]|uniref:hypothetical protein n=1 Tax=Streptomyces stelliscabiei TaxID=146820 RepID=UPI0029BDAC35|nr:hypothetical protein [Streptomyces stelliscabiei]MDX2554745.1 hypothetical protein [Streptomyces stelliscabiei]MDX2613272.1 hypothetical protein [Streptomyces stelliscabiei]MDX2638452.1 hypothetical protein [Streptomyces stelliscabiei]MDX2661604.1 hypothetical protein [Streptomyces stelliscabiei]MDX2712263.1 hypothetical protein [Streptomyces stelliscabiei]